MHHLGKSSRVLFSAIVVVVLCGPLTGCFDLVELEDQAFVPAIGLDKGPNGTMFLTARIDIPGKLASSGGGGGSDVKELGGAKPITVQARSIPEALTLLNTAVERRISLTHLSAVVFGQDLAKDGTIAVLRPMTRYREFRRTVFLFVAKGSAKDVFDNNKPILEKSVTRYVEDFQQISRDYSMAPIVQFQNFLVNIETKTEDPIAPIIAVNQSVVKGSKEKGGGDKDTQGGGGEEGGAKQGGLPKSTDISYVAGKISRSGGNPDEYIGAAIFRADKLKTILDGQQTRYLLMVRGEFGGSMIHFPDAQQKGKYVNVILRQSTGPDIDVDVHSKPVAVHIRMPLEAEIIGEDSTTNYVDARNVRRLEQSMERDIEASTRQLVTEVLHKEQADPFELFRHARALFPTHQALEAYDWHSKLKQVKVDVKATVKLRRIGTQLQPPQT